MGKAAAKRSMGDLEDALIDWNTADQIQPLSDDEQARRQECLQQLADSRRVSEQTTGTDAMDGLSTADSMERTSQAYMMMCKYREALQILRVLIAVDSKGRLRMTASAHEATV